MTRWPVNNVLSGDPAQGKSRYLNGGPASADYFNRIKAYDVGLYQPSDTRPAPAALPKIAPLSTSSGWQTGDPNTIAARYGGGTATGLAGPVGMAGESAQPDVAPPSIIDTAPRAQMPDVAPKQNAQQRWMGTGKTPEGPVNSGSTERYYDRKLARNSRDPQTRMQARAIDGSAPNVTNQPAPVQFTNSSSNWEAF